LIEFFWNAAQYVLGSASRPGKVVPALWGPWVINDVPSWYGDMTMVRETHLLRAILI
jgi:alpha-L-fucosidase 2